MTQNTWFKLDDQPLCVIMNFQKEHNGVRKGFVFSSYSDLCVWGESLSGNPEPDFILRMAKMSGLL